MTLAEPDCPAITTELLDWARSDTAKKASPDTATTAHQILLPSLRIGIHLYINMLDCTGTGLTLEAALDSKRKIYRLLSPQDQRSGDTV